MKYMTSDLHLHHANIIKYCNRPFADVASMYDAIAANWDKTVTPNDEIYILGDLGFNFEVVKSFLTARPGHKFWCYGNHDVDGAKRAELEKLFVKSGDILETKDPATGAKIVMCHYPMIRWNKGHFGSWMLHGHCHGSPIPEAANLRLVDVGVDVWSFTPVSVDTLRPLMIEKPINQHHMIEVDACALL